MKLDRELFHSAREYFRDDGAPYGGEAEHALRCFLEMLDALKAVQEERPRMNPGVWAKVNKAVANAEDTGD